MMEYYYKKAVSTSLLKKMIVDSSLNGKFDSVIQNGDFVELSATPALTAPEKAVLDGLISGYDTHPFKQREDLKPILAQMKIEGDKILDDYALKNKLRGYTEAQVYAVADYLRVEFDLAKSGALATLKYGITNKAVTAEFTQEDKDEFIAKINAILGV